MKRPQLLGCFNDHPVIRCDTEEVLMRVWPWATVGDGKPFRPGPRLEVDGMVLRLPESLSELDGFASRCSTARLVRVIQAYGQSSAIRGAA